MQGGSRFPTAVRFSVLMLPPGGGDLSALRATAGNDPAGRLLELADTVRAMSGT